MPVRLRITFLFTLLVFIILGLVCASTYYFTYQLRINTVKTRLTNRAITIGRLLSQSDIFSNELIQKIDSATSIAFVNKVIQAYDYKDNKIYSYSSLLGDSLNIPSNILDDARVKGNVYFTMGRKDAVAHHYTDSKNRIIVIAAGEDEEGKENLKQLIHVLLLSYLGGLLIAFLGGYFFSRGLLKPIKKIADDVNVISAQNLSTRIYTGNIKDEWYYLSDTLNALLNRLQESFDLQKRFIANASHELSTPLTSISSQIEVSLQRERTSEDYKKVLQSILTDVIHMSKLTQTLLEFAKASGTAAGLEIELVRIDEVLFRLPAEIVKTNNAYSVSFDFDDLPQEEDKLLVFGNEELLFTAIKNIVVNACKYSSDHRAVIKLAIAASEINISISDTGAGIPEKDLEKIFQPFYRVNENIASEGFGLGLSLANRIIKLHKGEVSVASSLGNGSTFNIRIPSAKHESSTF
jgi:two-component system, OmpR family, sensor histidine kinase ArlS